MTHACYFKRSFIIINGVSIGPGLNALSIIDEPSFKILDAWIKEKKEKAHVLIDYIARNNDYFDKDKNYNKKKPILNES